MGRAQERMVEGVGREADPPLPILRHARATSASRLTLAAEVVCCQGFKRCAAGLSAATSDLRRETADHRAPPILHGGVTELVEQGSLVLRRRGEKLEEQFRHRHFGRIPSPGSPGIA